MFNLRQIRKEKNIKVKHAAAVIGVSPSYLRRIEKGKANVTVDKLIKLTDLYGYKVTLQKKT